MGGLNKRSAAVAHKVATTPGYQQRKKQEREQEERGEGPEDANSIRKFILVAIFAFLLIMMGKLELLIFFNLLGVAKLNTEKRS